MPLASPPAVERRGRPPVSKNKSTLVRLGLLATPPGAHASGAGGGARANAFAPRAGASAQQRAPARKRRAEDSDEEEEEAARAGGGADGSGADDDSSSADDDADADGARAGGGASALLRRAHAASDDDDDEGGGDDPNDAYFSAQRRASGVALGRLFSALPGAGDPEALRAAVRALGGTDRTSLSRAQARELRGRHGQWLALLRSGFHVLLHGAGSKRLALDHFVRNALGRTGSPVIVLQGYASRARMRSLLSLAAERLGAGAGCAASVREACLAIEAVLRRGAARRARATIDGSESEGGADDDDGADDDGGDGDGAAAAAMAAAEAGGGADFKSIFASMLPTPPAASVAMPISATRPAAGRAAAAADGGGGGDDGDGDSDDDDDDDDDNNDLRNRAGGKAPRMASPAAAAVRRRLAGGSAPRQVFVAGQGGGLARGGARAAEAGARAPAASELFVVVHSVDGLGLRAERSQDALAALAKVPGVRVIASCDHVNAAMLWDSARAAALGWVWEEVATALPHLAELADGDALAHLLGHAGGGKGGAAALSQAASARAVLGALNLNGKKVFRELAQHALAAAADEAKASVAAEEASQAPRVRAAARGTATGAKTAAKRSLTETRAESARARGLTLHELLERCRRGLFANGEASLRRHLSEFVDHRLVELERASGSERYAVCLPEPIIKELMSSVLNNL